MSKKKQYANFFLYVLMIFVSQNVHAISLKSDQYDQHQSVISNSSIMNHSSKFKHRSTAAQPSPIGRSSSGKYKNIGGFWHPFMTDQHQSNTYFLIVAGGGKNPKNLLWFTTEFLSNRFYRMLIRHDYTHEQIMYISDHSYHYDFDADGTPEIIVDDHDPSVEDIRLYLEDFYSEENSILNENSRLIIYLNDHGGPGIIKIGAGEYLDSEIFDGWLDQLQDVTSCQVVVIAEACRSGTFIEPLSPGEDQKRILISSSNKGVSRYEDKGMKSFSKLLFEYISQGADLKSSYEYVCDQMKKHFRFFKFQTPVLIDGHEENFAAQFKICTTKGDSFPEITDSTSDTTIDKGLLSFYVKASDLEGSIVVWATVIKPDFFIPKITIDFETPIIESERIELIQTDEQNTYQGEYDFQCNGSYLLTFYAKDDIENIASKEIQITVQNGIDCLADLNNDLNIDLMDAITALNLCSNMDSNYNLSASTSDVNKDGYIGLEEVIYIFQKIAKQ
jgi:hypothetical protein